jgi:hypothetical protein
MTKCGQVVKVLTKNTCPVSSKFVYIYIVDIQLSHAEGEVPVGLSLKFVHATENPSYILKGIPLKLITIHVHLMIWRITDRFKILIKPFLKELFPFFSSKYVDRDIHLYMSTFPSNVLDFVGFGFMVFNATFNNISITSLWSVLLVEESPEKTTDLSQKQPLINVLDFVEIPVTIQCSNTGTLDKHPFIHVFLQVHVHVFNLIELPVLARRGSRGSDHMIVGFTTTYAISAYRH